MITNEGVLPKAMEDYSNISVTIVELKRAIECVDNDETMFMLVSLGVSSGKESKKRVLVNNQGLYRKLLVSMLKEALEEEQVLFDRVCMTRKELREGK